MSHHWLTPEWPLPKGVVALSTTRVGGVSQGAYSSFNLGGHVGDQPAAVAANRELLLDHLTDASSIQWLDQIHGTEVVKAADDGVLTADGCWSDRQGMVCAVMTADCLPVLFCTRDGQRVAAAHAGWRGLAEGILEATLDAIGGPDDVMAWLGPAIGPTAFEVGAEVRERFLAWQLPDVERAFISSTNPGRYLADIYQLARIRLRAAGVDAIYGGGWCTVSDQEQFFSYRRDGATGRMATLIYRML